jgi:hypothetical protein
VNSSAFAIVTVPPDGAGQLEQLGTKPKFWFDSNTKLFKAGRDGTGENWAEKVCAEIASLLGLPHATYELAVWKQTRGVVTPTFVPSGARLVHGNELIGRVVSGSEIDFRQYRRHLHTVSRIYGLLTLLDISPPLGWTQPEEVRDVFGVFSGYLLLDALVGNQDRHEENWAILVHDGDLFLAPTFDHASSLGRNESDIRRLELISSPEGMIRYVDRARSLVYSSNQVRLGTHEAFGECLRLAVRGSSYWLAQLAMISDDQFCSVVERVPGDWISEPARQFALKMIFANRDRLLHERKP